GVGLIGEKHRDLVVQGEAGLRVGANWNMGGLVTISPYVSGQYSHRVVGEGYRDRDLAFQGSPNGSGFNVRSAKRDRGQFEVGGGLALGIGMVKVELGYSQNVEMKGGNETNRQFSAGVSFAW
ncbi:MAG: autotransporter domain-containing protein, partial [Alphaproteobacteria bacterium]|nr:autotransporter domain-containing protein [Alphaproteobacteria bacterium]